MKKAIVFGGSGFIGSHLADHLLQAGYKTVVFDKSPSKWLKQDHDFISGDLLDPKAVENATLDASVVYNFAALADLNLALSEPIKSANVNIMGNLNLLEACKKNMVDRFVLASTVYVQSGEGGFYRCSKQAAESYVKEYQKRHNLNYTILRFGSLYGPRADNSNGVKKIIKDIIETGKIRYSGSKESAREYIHVEDAAIASIDALKPEFENKSIVLTGQESIKVIDFLKVVAEIMGLDDNAIEFETTNNIGHYVRTPYSYAPSIGKKYIPRLHVDLGQGLLQVIQEIVDEREQAKS